MSTVTSTGQAGWTELGRVIRSARSGAVAALAGVLAFAGGGAAPKPDATVLLTPTTQGVVADFALRTPTSRFLFARPAPGVRSDSWRLLTPGMTLQEEGVTAPRPFRRFRVLIEPDKLERDRVYPALFRTGGGYTLYGPYVRGRGLATTVRTRRLGRGAVALPAGDLSTGYVYLGPRAQVRQEGSAALVAGADVPPWLLAQITTDVRNSIDFYERALALPLGVRPTVVVSAQSPGPFPFRGDVTDGYVIALRFHGDAWKQPDPSRARRASGFVLHESFHLWNGYRFRPSEGEAAPWLHEGGAEYAALMARRAAGTLAEAQVRVQLERALAECRSALKETPLREGAMSGAAVYDCGLVLQWLADTRARETGGSIFTVWKDVFVRAQARGGAYTVADFRAASGDAVLAPLLDERGTARWARIAATLGAPGAEEKPSAP